MTPRDWRRDLTGPYNHPINGPYNAALMVITGLSQMRAPRVTISQASEPEIQLATWNGEAIATVQVTQADITSRPPEHVLKQYLKEPLDRHFNTDWSDTDPDPFM